MLAPMSSKVWRVLSCFVLGATLAAGSARPAAAADDGWFDPQAAPAPTATPTPPAADQPSLASSPLLDDRRPPAEADPADRNPQALSDFRPSLDPYGSWVQHPNYGTVWVPSARVVGTSFSPYVSSGRWALDEDGDWVWESDYPFGNVVFHYGRWAWAGGTGWVWVPGYRYAPAWVSWRVPVAGEAYVGWAPMGPDYIWVNGFAVSYWHASYTPWVFCPSSYVFHRHVHHYVVRDRGVVTRLASSTRRYAPAAPSSGSVRARSALVRSPSLAEARVPASAAPRDRVRRSANVWNGRDTSPGRVAVPRSRSAEPPSRAREPASRDSFTERRAPRPTREAPAERAVPAPRQAEPREHRSAPAREPARAPATERREFQPRPPAAERAAPRERSAPRERVESPRQRMEPRSEPRSPGGAGRRSRQ